MKDTYALTRKASRWLCLAAAAALIVPAAGWTATAKSKSKKAPVKISGSQLFQRLDSIDKRLKDIARKQTATRAPVKAAPGAAAEAGSLGRAYYNYGVYQKRAANLRLIAHAVRGLTVAGGSALAIYGWQSENDKKDLIPRTPRTAYKHYPMFSYGVSTAVLGVTVGYIVDLMAFRAERKGAEALMEPLEGAPDGAPEEEPAKPEAVKKK